jgi:hypothetical protein
MTLSIKCFLCKYYTQLSSKNISVENDFLDYDNFKSFINKRYNIDHLERHNYIKYVKVVRQTIRLKDDKKYCMYIDTINNYIKILSEHHVFPKKNIVKFMYKTNVFRTLIEKKRKILHETLKNIRNIFENTEYENKLRNLIGLNTFTRRCEIFNKYSTKIIYLFNKLILLEESYGIDHKLIELNNLQRSFLGKKSEYVANKVMKEYINKELFFRMNVKENTQSTIKFYYETNINFLKLLNINFDFRPPIKGEIDGLLISYDGSEYIIESFIEVKSSIKACFEDINKFVYLQNYIKNMDFSEDIIYERYTFSKNSFKNIFLRKLSDIVVYICINPENSEVIEKSHLYFSNVLKIIDDNFIKKYYIDKDESVIGDKYKIIQKNSSLVDELFEEWKKIISLDDDCNIFISK